MSSSWALIFVGCVCEQGKLPLPAAETPRRRHTSSWEHLTFSRRDHPSHPRTAEPTEAAAQGISGMEPPASAALVGKAPPRAGLSDAPTTWICRAGALARSRSRSEPSWAQRGLQHPLHSVSPWVGRSHRCSCHGKIKPLVKIWRKLMK